MNVAPSQSDFIEQAKRGNTIPVYLDLLADCETPLGAYAKLRDKAPAFLFESIVGGEQISRYSFLGTDPKKIFRVFERETHIENKDGPPETLPTPADPLSLIEAEMARHKPVMTPGMPPFTGGAVGFVAHELIHSIEPTVPKPSEDPLELPLLYYLITDSVLIFDHVRQVLRICVQAHIDGRNPETVYAGAVAEIKRIYQRLEAAQPFAHHPVVTPESTPVPPGNFTQERFEQAVRQVKSYVAAGDVIQTVLSQRFKKKFEPQPIDLYRALRTVNPSPYMFLLEDPAFAVVGASPEVHVRLTGDEVEIRPIAGTRQRGADPREDLALEEELLADEKEKAEHLMLVDLARNDIGRVCQYGSIHVPDYMIVERYSHVMHIVSKVLGKLRPECSAFDLMRATFPAGTLSGAPKVRALQIIAELEGSQRGVYGGALGYFGFDGNHDSCIGIRTAVVKDGAIHIQSGAGVVADSIPQAEFMETVNKAKGMLKAVALAEKMPRAPFL
jgi:anthranilate synthase component 1